MLTYIIYMASAFILSFFLCMMIYRLPREKNVIKYESVCPSCEEHVGAYHFIPFFGYLFRKGKYKCCDAKMSISRLLVPLLTIGLFALCVWRGEDCSNAKEMYRILMCLFSAVMLIVIFTDFETMIIPDSYHVVIIILAILGMVFKYTTVVSALSGAAVFFVAFYVIAAIAERKTGKEALGGGDIKLMGVCGLFLGLGRTLVGLLIGSFLGFVIELLLIAFKAKKKGQYVAFGPYLAIGMLFALTFGNTILDAYFKLFGISQ